MGRFRRYRRQALYDRKCREGVITSSTSSSTWIAMPPKCGENRKVLVIGAGLAGSVCAWYLARAGFDVTVAEARERAGGRCHSLYDFANGRVVEAGGELIGLGHLAWLNLARHLGLSLNPLTEETIYEAQDVHAPVMLDGVKIAPDQLKEIETVVGHVLLRISDDAKRLTHPSEPWLESPEIQALDFISIKAKLDEWNVSGLARRLIELEFENDNLAPVSEQSYLGLLCVVKGGSPEYPEQYWERAENFRCAEGTETLADLLLDGLRVHKNNPIKSCTQDAATKQIHVIGERETYTVDYVVLATPPPTWDAISFQGGTVDLSLRYATTMGPAGKFLTQLPYREWITQGLTANGFSSSLGQTWEATEGQTINESQSVTLTVFAGGTHYVEDEKHYQHQLAQLFSHNFDLDAHALILWPTQVFTRCGYSFSSLGQVTTRLPLLNAPVAEFANRLFFAGEHCSPDFVGCMESALLSGLRAAKRIMSTSNT